MSNLSDLLPAGAGAKSATFTASGTLASGTTVALQSDGTVTAVGETSDSAGSGVVFESASTNWMAATFDSSANKVVVAYADVGNSSYGTAVVGTVSGTSISFGSAVVFNSGDTEWIASTYDVSSGKIVVAYRDAGNNYYGTAIVGTVSGTSISFGSEVVFYSTYFENISISYDSTASKVVIFGTDGNNNYGYGIVGTVSGTSISFGSAANFVAGSGSSQVASSYDAQSNKTVVIYDDLSSSQYPTVKIGTVSGTSISFGTAVVVNSAGATNYASVYDTENEKTVVFYRDSGNSNYGTANVGTVSGTSISFGTAVVFEAADSYRMTATYDSNNTKIVLAYSDFGNARYGTAVVGTVSGTSISFSTPVPYVNNRADSMSVTFDSTANKAVIAFQDASNSNHGTSVVFTVGSSNNTDFVGITDQAIADTATGSVVVEGGVTAKVSGLTTGSTYYVQDDGSLSTTSSSVTAGKALSSTTLLLKG